MEENTMSKNDAEESRSVSDEQERPAEGGTESRHANRTVDAEKAESRRANRAADTERTESRRASRAADTERAESRRANRAADTERTESRRASRAAERKTTGSRRTDLTTEEARARRRAERSKEQMPGRHIEMESAGRRETDRSSLRDRQRGRREERIGRISSSQSSESRTARQHEMQSGKFGLGHQKTRRSAIAYFFEDIAEGFVRAKNWCVKNYRTSIPAAICLVLVIVVACILVRNFRMQPAPVENMGDQIQEYPLEQDAYEHVNSFFQKYYEASTFGDVETYASMRSYTDATERIRMQKKANYIDYYQNLSCYTKPGPIENSFLVYVYYEVKFRGINTPAPGLKTYYLCTNDAGELYVFSGEVDKNVDEYMRTVSLQEDVKDLFNRVKVTYNNAVASDKELEEFLAVLADNLKDEVTLALLEEEAQNPVADNEDESGGDVEQNEAPEESEPTPEPEAEPQTDRVVTTDRVNVRSSASPEATKLGTVAAGMQFTRYESLENGWSKIDYEGSEAYIKTEFLQVVEATLGKVKATESVNIRASASEDATKLGTVSVGTVLDLIENQENGWSRILFNGSTAYVKTEFLDIENMTQ